MIAFIASPKANLDSSSIMRLLLMKQPFIPRSRLYLMEDTGELLRCLTERKPPEAIRTALWSPDGTELIFTTAQSQRIYRFHHMTQRLSEVTLPRYQNAAPFVIDWMEGFYIVMYYQGEKRVYGRVAVNTLQLDVLFEVPEYVSTAFNGVGELFFGEAFNGLLVYSYRGSEKKNVVTYNGLPASLANGTMPVWAPNGKYVALAFEHQNGEDILCVISFEPFMVQQIGAIAFESPIAWSFDSGSLAYIAEQNGRDMLHVSSIVDGEIHALAPIDSGSIDGALHACFAWTHDNAAIVYAHAEDEEADVRLFRVETTTRSVTQLTDQTYMPIRSIICS